MSKKMFGQEGTAGWMKGDGRCNSMSWMVYGNAKQPQRMKDDGSIQTFIGSFMMFREKD